MGFVEEVHGEVGGVADHGVTVAAAEVGADFGEEIEGALGIVDLQSGNFAGETHNEVAAAAESLTHLADALLRPEISGLSGLLSD